MAAFSLIVNRKFNFDLIIKPVCYEGPFMEFTEVWFIILQIWESKTKERGMLALLSSTLLEIKEFSILKHWMLL